jgi:uncharacterized protein (DUF58 family)
MRPSPRLVVLALTLVALSTLVVLLARDAIGWLWILWGGLALVALADLFLSVPRRDLVVDVRVPTTGYTGGSAQLVADVTVRKGVLPPGLVAVLDVPAALGSGIMPDPVQVEDGRAQFAVDLPLMRRGAHVIRALSLKWLSRLGLFELITDIRLDRSLTIVPDIAPILSGQINTRMLPLTEGLKDMQLRGEGSEFHQLREFQPGMDPRSIDWKRSARGRSLVARETRAERNHQIMLCLDSGYLMGEHIDGLPKLDRAMNAALAMAWAGGLGGDQVGLYSFDSRPRVFIPPAPGRAAFARLQATCARMGYDSVETNHTLALTHLHGRLKRRSLVIVFSDFVDSITAELLVENIAVMARHHLILYVALRDPALIALAQPTSVSLEAIARSVSATQILRERQSVLDRLARLGVLCLDTTPAALTGALVARYIDIKSRELI